MKTKICTVCKQKKLLSEFHKRQDTDDGLRYKCKDCANRKRIQWFLKNREKVKEYNRSEVGRKSQMKYCRSEKGRENSKKKNKIRRRRYPEKRNAQSLLQYAVKVGKIKRPVKCSQCGKKCEPEGHHNDYNRPLKVTWLCHQCHINIHVNLSEGE